MGVDERRVHDDRRSPGHGDRHLDRAARPQRVTGAGVDQALRRLGGDEQPVGGFAGRRAGEPAGDIDDDVAATVRVHAETAGRDRRDARRGAGLAGPIGVEQRRLRPRRAGGEGREVSGLIGRGGGDVDRQRDGVARYTCRWRDRDRLAWLERSREAGRSTVEHALGGDRHVATRAGARRRAEPAVDVDDDARRRRRPDVDRPAGAELHDRPVGAVLGGAVVDRRGVRQGLSGRPRGEEAGGLRLRGGDGHGHRRGVRRNTAPADHRDADAVGTDRREAGAVATVGHPARRDRLEFRRERSGGRGGWVECGRDHQRGEHRRDGDPSGAPEVGHRETSRSAERG